MSELEKTEIKIPVPEPVKEKLDPKIPVPEPVKEKLDPIEIANFKQEIEKLKARQAATDALAIKGLVSEFKNEDQRKTVESAVAGKGLDEAIKLVEAFKSFVPVAKPATLPASNATGGAPPKSPSRYDQGYKHAFVDNRPK